MSDVSVIAVEPVRHNPVEYDIRQRFLYSRKEVAEYLSISVRKLDYLIAAGQIKTVPMGRRVMIRRQELERFARCGSGISQ